MMLHAANKTINILIFIIITIIILLLSRWFETPKLPRDDTDTL